MTSAADLPDDIDALKAMLIAAEALKQSAFNLHHQLRLGRAFDGTFLILIKRGLL